MYLNLKAINVNGGVGADDGFGMTQATVHLDRVVLDGTVSLMGVAHSHDSSVDAIWRAVKSAVGREESDDWLLEKYLVDQKMNSSRGGISGVTRVRILAGLPLNRRRRYWGESPVSDPFVAAAIAMLNAINKAVVVSEIHREEREAVTA